MKKLTIFATGHSKHPIQRFISILKAHHIECLADIRTVPESKHNPQFGQKNLMTALKSENIGYIHMKSLGGLRKPRRDSLNVGWQNSGFRGYADYMETKEFESALEKLINLAQNQVLAIMCAEGNPFRCHRSLVADALTIRNIEVIHISSKQPGRVHEITPFARVHGNHIIYNE